MKSLVIKFIQAYRYGLSPFLGAHCRYYPSCSCYAEEAVSKFGLRRGLTLALSRVLRCHPGHPGGIDPLP